MAYTVYTAAQARDRANAITRYQTGMCLGFTRQCLNGEKGVGLYDANAAWTAAKQKETTGTPPAGAPVYFKGGAHGHIAISVGGGKVRSTDYQTSYGYRTGYVGTATINEVALEFFGTTSAYRGWSRDYAGLIIRGLEETNTNYSPPPVVPEEDEVVTDSDIRKIAAAVAAYMIPNHDPNPNDSVKPASYAAKSYWVMANYRAAELQKQVAALRAQVSALTAKVDKL